MPDCGLRRLQRRFHQSGLPCDEARWLHGRLRAGDVTVEQVELAAYAGHPPSRLFLHAPAEPPQALSAWVRSLPRNRYREAALARAAIAAVNAALGSSCPPFTPDFPLSRHLGEVLHAAEQVLVGDLLPIDLLLPQREALQDYYQTPYRALAQAAFAAHCVARALRETTEDNAAQAALSAERLSGEDLSHAVKEELLPWILGYSDPVQTRVSARTATPAPYAPT